MPEQALKIKCPHCGKVRSINPAVFTGVKGLPSPALEKAYQQKRAAVVEGGRQTGGWVNLKCPSCGNPYQFNPKTSRVRLKPSRTSG
jgi:predicted RNA-binding Zn-ribbon protein involved in translation (DUF1610 family)